MIHNTIRQLADASSPVPGLQDIFNCNPLNPQGCSSPIPRLPGVPNLATPGDIISSILNIVFYLAIFAAFYFFVWGGFLYIVAQGKKENLAKARDRIMWALVGLMIVLLAYFIAKFVTDILGTNIKGYIPF